MSMEGRAFGLHPQRTHMRELVTTRRDLVAGALLAASVLAGIAQAVIQKG